MYSILHGQVSIILSKSVPVGRYGSCRGIVFYVVRLVSKIVKLELRGHKMSSSCHL